jgi:PPOX class probable F420-dependent enzyme
VPARLSDEEQRRFLAGRHVAVLVTVGEDGAPVPSPIWYLYRDGAFHFRTADDSIKAKNIRRDPRVSICVQDERPPYRAITAYGRAMIVPAAEWLADELPRHYLGFVGAIGYKQAAQAIEQGPEVTLVVRPDRITSFDFAPETPVYGRWWLLLKRILPPWI